MVIVGKWLTEIALALYIPIKWLIKPTIFKHFCGGETVKESREKMAELAKSNLKSVLDYSAEGKHSETDFDNCAKEIIDIIQEASKNTNIGFSVFKPTGVARFALLEKISTHLLDNGQVVMQGSNNSKYANGLSELELKEFTRAQERFNRICKASFEAGVPVFVDAEESWIQKVVDELVKDMMNIYNREKPIVYNTFQLYRTDRVSYLKECYALAEKENYFLGAKLVRGAYMEKERARAIEKGYDSPINKTKDATDLNYDSALEFCMSHLDRVAFCCASHNEKSTMLVVKKMEEAALPKNHSRIYFSQLLGMSDHISFNLASAGYNVSKYVPYGPIRDVLPYLIRRAQENTSVKGQTGRELGLIKKERQRRVG